MPTVIVLDSSLSMCRPVQVPDVTGYFQYRVVAVHGLRYLLDYMNINCKLEFASLMSLSSYREPIVSFTRDFESIKLALLHMEFGEHSRIIKALERVQSLIMEEWGAGVPCQVLLITDGVIGPEVKQLKKGIEESNFPLPFPFPCKLHILCIANSTDDSMKVALPIFQKLVDISGGGGQVHVPEGPLNFESAHAMFVKMAETYYKPFHGIIHCGMLTSNVALSPPPEPFFKIRDFEMIQAKMSTDIEICGFMNIADVSSPPSHSRHLILPLQSTKDDIKPIDGKNNEDETANEDGKQPSFCVLLHGSLRKEGMIAICQLGPDWYGMLYSWAGKKKSNLMLSVFEPGLDAIPWLGSLSNMGPTELVKDCDPPTDPPTFPIKPSPKKSYAQNSVVWINQTGLQADIHKILQLARKLPEKTENFYKELNRLRRAALSFGFIDLLDGMANILDRECTLLPDSSHPDAALQLTHCANALRNLSKDYHTPILPQSTKFSMDE